MKFNGVWFGISSNSSLSALEEYYQKSESLLIADRKRNLEEILIKAKKMGKERNLSEDEEWGEYSILLDGNNITYDMFFTNYFRYSFIVLVHLYLKTI